MTFLELNETEIQETRGIFRDVETVVVVLVSYMVSAIVCDFVNIIVSSSSVYTVLELIIESSAKPLTCGKDFRVFSLPEPKAHS